MKNGRTERGGRKIQIPVIKESSRCNGKKPVWVSVGNLEGRPTKVMKRFVDLGFSREWFNAKLFEEMVIFGWDRGYLKTDAGIISLPFKYFLKDMDWTRHRRLKEVDENGSH